MASLPTRVNAGTTVPDANLTEAVLTRSSGRKCFQDPRVTELRL